MEDLNTPTLAVTAALDEYRGETIWLAELRDAYRFHGGGDYPMTKALELHQTLHPGDFEWIYVRQPGWYTELKIHVRSKYK